MNVKDDDGLRRLRKQKEERKEKIIIRKQKGNKNLIRKLKYKMRRKSELNYN